VPTEDNIQADENKIEKTTVELNAIGKNKVVAFHYVLKDEAGEVLEQSSDADPMVYLHGGYRNLLPRLEEALAGTKVGGSESVTLPPEHAYGMRRDDALQRVPIKHLLTKAKKYKVGMAVKVNTGEGPRDVVITKVGRFNVDVDMNHPLAGKTVTFEVQVKDIRDATPEELTHGHSHGWEGKPHHH